MDTAVLIAAAGTGSRAGAGSRPKQYADIGGEAVLARALRPFLECPHVTAVQVIINQEHDTLYREAVARFENRLLPPVAGGGNRQDSVRRGLEALAPLGPRHVLIHDAARPFVTSGVIGRVLAALERCQGVVPVEPLADTLKQVDPGGRILATAGRTGLFRAQTPQGFHFPLILALHQRAANEGRFDFTDDAALLEWAGQEVVTVPGSPLNTKITTAEDLAAARQQAERAAVLEPRTGTGFDVHRFAPTGTAPEKRPEARGPSGTATVFLCGVPIPHVSPLEGHSDADAGLHALTDALLGALGDGDIGEHFPPNDPRWKGAASSIFLAEAARRVAARGGRIVHTDVTLICEAPKIAPYRAAMRAAIASVLGLSESRVSVKATTTETLGFTGRREGIAALASATVLLPGGD